MDSTETVPAEQEAAVPINNEEVSVPEEENGTGQKDQSGFSEDKNSKVAVKAEWDGDDMDVSEIRESEKFVGFEAPLMPEVYQVVSKLVGKYFDVVSL